MNRAVAHGIPGTTFSNIFEKDDYDPAKHAVITFSTLKWMIRKWIVDVYHQQPHRALQTTPAKMWTSSIRPEHIPHPDESAQLDAIMGRVYQRVLDHKGIEFEGLFYNSPELTSLRIKEGRRLEVEIRVDESDIGSIYVLWPKTNNTYNVPALNSEYADGTSLWQHTLFKKRQREKHPSNADPSGWLKAKEEIQKKIEEDLHLKRRRTRSRAARHDEANQRSAVKGSAREAKLNQFGTHVSISSRNPVTSAQASTTVEPDDSTSVVLPVQRVTPKTFKSFDRKGYDND
jgi:putative transposase